MRLLAGLGNPGTRFTDTRHNAGYLVLDELARRQALAYRSLNNADVARGGRLWLVKPTTFMNLSGIAIQGVMTRHGIQRDEILVVHDDLDLPLGRLRFKQGGGAGGQRGVQDIIARIGPDFLRLKVGIGRPPTAWTTEHWVLSRFAESERGLLEQVVTAAADAVEMLLREGLEPAMNRTNGLDLTEPPAAAPNTPNPNN